MHADTILVACDSMTVLRQWFTTSRVQVLFILKLWYGCRLSVGIMLKCLQVIALCRRCLCRAIHRALLCTACLCQACCALRALC